MTKTDHFETQKCNFWAFLASFKISFSSLQHPSEDVFFFVHVHTGESVKPNLINVHQPILNRKLQLYKAVRWFSSVSTVGTKRVLKLEWRKNTFKVPRRLATPELVEKPVDRGTRHRTDLHPAVRQWIRLTDRWKWLVPLIVPTVKPQIYPLPCRYSTRQKISWSSWFECFGVATRTKRRACRQRQSGSRRITQSPSCRGWTTSRMRCTSMCFGWLTCWTCCLILDSCSLQLKNLR